MITEFEEPKDLQEAYDRKRQLVAQVEDIQSQLSNQRTKKQTMSPDEFRRWRGSAIWAHTNRKQELRWIKQWIRENESQVCASCGAEDAPPFVRRHEKWVEEHVS
jgi:hypothetical protein